MKNQPDRVNWPALGALILFGLLVMILSGERWLQTHSKAVPPQPPMQRSYGSSSALSDRDYADALSWCRLMQKDGVDYAHDLRCISDRRIRMDLHDPSDGIYYELVFEYAGSWRNRTVTTYKSDL